MASAQPPDRPGVPITTLFDLGEHSAEVAADRSITLVDNAAYQQASNFTATETVSLSSDEAYRLLLLLQTVFVSIYEQEEESGSPCS
jgi:hypothetical protein